MQLEPVDPTVRFPWPSSNGSDHEIKLKLCPCLIIVRWFLSNHSHTIKRLKWVPPTWFMLELYYTLLDFGSFLNLLMLSCSGMMLSFKGFIPHLENFGLKDFLGILHLRYVPSDLDLQCGVQYHLPTCIKKIFVKLIRIFSV